MGVHRLTSEASETEVQLDFWPSYLESLTLLANYATLRKRTPEPQGEMQPPWAETSFSYRFSGLPPTECYED